MNVKTWIPLILAVALGVIAMVVARKALHSSGESTEPATIAKVVILKHDVPPGKELGAEDMEVMKTPSAYAPTRAFANVQDAIGRVPTSELVKGQPVLETQLAPKGTGTGLSAMIPEGMRGFTIEVNEFSGLAGMLIPGAHVDVVTVVRDEKQQQPMSRTILQNIKIVAVGRNLSAAAPADGQQPPPPSNNVTLLVTPKQAQSMQLAMQSGRPWLVLRNGRDEKIAEVQVTSMAELNSPDGAIAGREPLTNVAMSTTQPATTQPAPTPKVRLVQVINGGVITTVQVPIAPDEEQEKPELLPQREIPQTVRNSDEEAAAATPAPQMIEKPEISPNKDTTEVADVPRQPTTQPAQTAQEPLEPAVPDLQEIPEVRDIPQLPEIPEIEAPQQPPIEVDVPTEFIPQVNTDPSEQPGVTGGPDLLGDLFDDLD